MEPATYRTRPAAITAVLKARPDTRELSVTGSLTYPGVDLAGDIVRPDGLDFSAHRRDPWVDLEHDGTTRAGWCRKSLAKPGKPYDVVRSVVDVPGHGPTALPFATVSFDPHDAVQSQTFALFEEGALTGFSLEFRPVPGFFKSLGHRSPLEARDAMRFDRADVVRFTVCATPVCEGAVVLEDGLVRKSLDRFSVPPPLAKVLSDGRVRGEALADPVRKALAKYAAPGRTVVRVEKAMDDEPAYADAAPDATQPDVVQPDAAADEAPALGGVSALYNHVQALLDACDQLESDMQSSDSPELRKFGEKIREKVAAIAEAAKGMADKHDAKLNGDGGGEESDPDGDGDDDTEADMDTDEDGTLKAVRSVYKTILKARRAKKFTQAEVQKGIQPDEPRDDPALAAEVERERRKNRRLKADFETELSLANRR